MKKFIVTALSIGALIAPVGLAAPVSAAVGPDEVATPTVTMPGVQGITLAKAIGNIQLLSEETNFRISSYNLKGYTQEQLTPAQWVVCRQSPAAGRTITARTRINLGVARPWQGC